MYIKVRNKDVAIFDNQGVYNYSGSVLNAATSVPSGRLSIILTPPLLPLMHNSHYKF